MPFCNECGNPISDTARFCTTCGAATTITVTESPRSAVAGAPPRPADERLCSSVEATWSKRMMRNHAESVSGLERLLFGVARGIALLGAVVALSGIVICSLYLLGKLDKSTSVSYSEIEAMLAPSQAAGRQSRPGTASSPATAYEQLPQNLRRYLTVDEAQMLRGRLQGSEGDEQWQIAVNDLSSLVGEAEARSAAPRDVMNAYVELRNNKLVQSDMDKYLATAGRVAATASIAGLLFLLVQVSLVLVVLAIERHTRTAVPSSNSQGRTVGSSPN